jgi:hypothetical protein
VKTHDIWLFELGLSWLASWSPVLSSFLKMT